MISDLFAPPKSDTLRYVVAANAPNGPADTPGAPLRELLREVGTCRLRDVARPGMRVVIAFTDATRHAPDEAIVTIILEELLAAGLERDAVTLLCAVGLHRPMTAAERRAKLGVHADAMRVLDHDARNAEGLVALGHVGGLPVVVNRLLHDADLVIATGVVEPHQYAGFSGGAKTAVIGCGGEATIAATHGPAMLDRPGVRLGRIDGNPFQEFVRAAGRMIGVDYAVNAVLDEQGDAVAAAAGAPDDVHNHLAALCSARCGFEVDAPVHMAILGVSEAKGSNLYQASRAVTYVARADRTPLLPGAPVVLCAEMPEGAGVGTGELRFAEALTAAESPAALLESMRAHGFPAGAQRAYILAQALALHPVIVAAPGHAPLIRACHMEYAPTLELALPIAERIARERFAVQPTDRLRCLVVPNALATLVRLRSDVA